MQPSLLFVVVMVTMVAVGQPAAPPDKPADAPAAAAPAAAAPAAGAPAAGAPAADAPPAGAPAAAASAAAAPAAAAPAAAAPAAGAPAAAAPAAAAPAAAPPTGGAAASEAGGSTAVLPGQDELPAGHVQDVKACGCSQRVMKVCGSDSRTYRNKCALLCVQKKHPGLEIKRRGPCYGLASPVANLENTYHFK